jgi:hypothetical protein
VGAVFDDEIDVASVFKLIEKFDLVLAGELKDFIL